MKTKTLAGIVIFGGVFASIAVGHPHQIKRAVVTEVAFTTVTVANVIVWVDENGNPTETTTVASSAVEPEPTSIESVKAKADTARPTDRVSSPAQRSSAVVSVIQPAPKSDVVTSATIAAYVAPVASAAVETPSHNPEPAPQTSVEAKTETAPPKAPESSPAPAPPKSPESSAEPAPTKAPEPRPETAADDSLPIGVTWDPYTTGNCKSEDQINSEWQQMKQYGIVRVYTMDCNLYPIVLGLAKANNQKIFAGVWLTSGGGSEDIDTVVKTVTNAVRNNAGGDWSIISLFSVENERVNERDLTASAVIDAVNHLRSSLRYAGYDGPVGAVETVPAMIGNPSICQNSDVAMVNVHPFFDSNTRAEDSGQFVRNEVERVRTACNKRVIVTESGWPHQGDSHDKAVPSRENQKKAIDSIFAQFDHDLFLFNAFDTNWKTDWAGSFNAEKYWGMF